MKEKFDDEISLDENLFAEKYTKMVTKIARKYYLEGGDYDDLIQEGMIGLITAIRAYDKGKSDNFDVFVAMCVKRKIFDAIRKEKRGNGKLDLILTDFESHEEYSDNLNEHNPEAQFLVQESVEEIEKSLANLLSMFESSVAELYLCGLNSKEIADKLNKSKKSVENAIVRIRKKAECSLFPRR